MKKKILIPVLAILLLLTVMVVSFAWFYINESTYVDFGSDIVCEAGDSLEISDDNGVTWSGVINKSGFAASTVDITGDGLALYKPIEIDATATPTGFTDALAVGEDGTGEYVEINLMFRSTAAMSVYLSEDSAVLPADPDREGNILGGGAFSRDFIAGATRVAFISGGELKMIWAPNPEYELTKTDGSYTFTENGTQETYYKTKKTDAGYVTEAVSADEYASSTFVAGSTEANGAAEGRSARLLTITPAENGYGTADLTVRIWFEGTDREATEALAGGRVAVMLKFTGIDKADNAEKQQAIDAITYDGESFDGLVSGMSYSLDGVTWTEYSAETGLPDLSTYSRIYFRYDETSTEFRTTVNIIELT